MKKELEDKLYAKYPEIFKDKDADLKNSLMSFGIECGDGWYFLIDQLCRTLSSKVIYLKKRIVDMQEMVNQEDKSNWSDWESAYYTQESLSKLQEQLKKESKNIPVAIQVKEKFGGLRFYVSGATDEQYAQIAFAENLSHRICVVCGDMNDAKTYQMGWHRTFCPTHAIEHYGKEDVDAYEQHLKDLDKF